MSFIDIKVHFWIYVSLIFFRSLKCRKSFHLLLYFIYKVHVTWISFQVRYTTFFINFAVSILMKNQFRPWNWLHKVLGTFIKYAIQLWYLQCGVHVGWVGFKGVGLVTDSELQVYLDTWIMALFSTNIKLPTQSNDNPNSFLNLKVLCSVFQFANFLTPSEKV